MIRLKELRKERRINQQKLAMELNMTQANISRYELGMSEPDFSVLIKIADYFEVSIDYLIGRTDYNQPPQKHNALEEAFLTKYRKLSRFDQRQLEGYLDRILDETKKP